MKKIKISISKKGAIIALSVTLFTVLADYFSKILVMENMTLRQSIPIIKNVFHLTYITNPGAAFGSLAGARWLFMTASSLLILVLVALLLFWDDRSTLFYVSTSMVLGGGIGNMIDRLFNGETFGNGVVIDFIDFCAFPEIWKWVFNVADSFVCVGVALLIASFVADEVSRAKKHKSLADGSDDGDDEDAEV